MKDDAIDVVWKVKDKKKESFDSDSVLKTSESSPTLHTDSKSEITFVSEMESEDSPNKDWS